MINIWSDDPLPVFIQVTAKSDTAVGGFEFAGLNHDEFCRESAFRVLYVVEEPVEQEVDDPPK
jgi:hypothetical protein